MEGEPLPLFYDEVFTVVTDTAKAERVWKGVQKKLSAGALRCLTQCWLAEEAETPMVLFRYIRKVVDAPRSIETNFADPDVLAFARMWKRVSGERWHLIQFIRFQKAADGTYFAAVEPEKNALPLVIDHFRDRLGDQRWVVYDVGRGYGFYFDGQEVRHVTFADDSDGQGRTPLPTAMEDVLQGHLHQGAVEPAQAPSGHARALLEVLNGETRVMYVSR